jgi:hypothetical protein
MITKSFDKWDTDDVEQTFGVRRTLRRGLLQDWIEIPVGDIEASTRATLEALRMKLFLYVNGWNEDELKFRFIAPLVNTVDFDIEEKKHSYLYTAHHDCCCE